MLIVFLAFKHALNAIKMLNQPASSGAASGLRLPGRPGSRLFTFFHNRQFGGWLILGLIVDTLLHVIPLHGGSSPATGPRCNTAAL